MLTTDIPNSENQCDWFKGIRYGSNCQKTDSTDVAELKKPVYNNIIVRRRIILMYRIHTSVPNFFLPTEKFTSTATKHKGHKLKRYIREHLPI